jgi:hypothetical protein
MTADEELRRALDVSDLAFIRETAFATENPVNPNRPDWFNGTMQEVLRTLDAVPAARSEPQEAFREARLAGPRSEPREHGEHDNHHHYRLECEVCGQPGSVNVIIQPDYVREAATPPAEGLDVERLRWAIEKHAASHKKHSRTHVRGECAEAVAVEYATLSPEHAE